MQDDLKNNLILDDNFVNSLTKDNFKKIIDTLYAITKPIVFRHMQKDLFRLSPNYKIQHNQNDKIWVNNRLVDPINVQADAYELIMPKIYQTQFGL
jgi:isocitrate dehydrogenase